MYIYIVLLNQRKIIMNDVKSAMRVGRGLVSQLSAFIELKRAYRTGETPSVLPLLYIELLKNCNLSCKHCGYASSYPEDGRLLKTSELFDIIKEAKGISTEIISFGGGEPFLREDIFDLIAYTQALNMNVHINTNATLLNKDKVLRLAKFSHMTLVVSLDHPEAEKNDLIRGQGVYEKVVNAIGLINQHSPQVRVGINCVIGPYNAGRLCDMLKLAKRLGVDSVKFTPAHDNLNHSWKKDGLAKGYEYTENHCKTLTSEIACVIKTARKLGIKTNSAEYLQHIPDYILGKKGTECYAGFIYGNIDPYGNLFPCYDHKENLNVKKYGLKKAWQSEEMQKMRQKVKNCDNKCWNTGNAEPSIRMNLFSLLKNPYQIIDDYQFYLK